MARKLSVEIVGDASGLERAFKSAGSAGSRFGGAMKTVGKAAGFAIGGAAIGGLAVTLKQGIGEWQDSAKVAAQTSAVLKSTGGAAGVTAKQVSDLSSALMAKSGVDDEAIQSGENMLLTFTNVRNEVGQGNDVFNQATATLLDMSVATGKDMSASAVTLGKALNDPVKGISALTRVGVTFTDGQKEQIKSMVAAGDAMGAQKIILGELNKEFGGSAEAVGKTLPGQLNKLKETFNNVAGELVANLIPALTGIVTWVNQHWPEIQATMQAVFTGISFAVGKVLVPAIRAIVIAGEAAVAWVKAHWPEISAVFMAVFNAAKAAWENVLKPAVTAIVAAFNTVVAWTKKHWPEISATIRGVFEVVKTIVQTAVTVITTLWSRFGDNILTEVRQTWEHARATIENALKIIRGIVNLVAGLIHGDWARAWLGIQQITGGVTGQIKNIISAFKDSAVGLMRAAGDIIALAWQQSLGRLVSFTTTVFGQIVGAIKGMAGSAFQAALSFGQSIVDGIASALGAIGDLVVRLVTVPINAVIDKINAIKIPGVHVPGITVNTHIPGVGKVGTPGFSTPTIDPIPPIPHIATGGFIARTGLAVVHRGETVIPARGGGVVNVTINDARDTTLDEQRLLTMLRRVELLYGTT